MDDYEEIPPALTDTEVMVTIQLLIVDAYANGLIELETPHPSDRAQRAKGDLGPVEALKLSLRQTGFWDNVVARERDGKAEIAYGHHRLVALQEEWLRRGSSSTTWEQLRDRIAGERA